MTLIVDERSVGTPHADIIWHGTSHGPGAFISTAAPFWELVVTDNGHNQPMVTVRGPETRPERLDYSKQAMWWGVRFPIGTHLRDIPLSGLVDSAISSPVSATGTFTICGVTCKVSDHTAAEALIHRLATQGILVRDSAVAAAWEGAPATLSHRSLQRRFRLATGLSQQTARQIQRARIAVELLRTGSSILDTVAQLGYSDQAHLTRSLTRWMGQTPARVAPGHQILTVA